MHGKRPEPETQTLNRTLDAPANKTTLLLPTLVLGSSLGELKDNTTASKAAVDLRVGIEPVVNTTTLLLVKDDLEGLGAVLLGAEALTDDLDRVDEVGKDSVVHSGEGARAGTLLLQGVAGAGRALGAGKNAARGQDKDMAVRELLLQLAGQTVVSVSIIRPCGRGGREILTAAGHGGSPAGKGRGQR